MSLLLLFSLLCRYCISQHRYDLVIDEIMADPSPQVGLPKYEYLELKNVSRHPINLNGWKIMKEEQPCPITTDFLLKPDSFVILCSISGISALAAYGPALPLSNFSSLTNEGGLLSLVSKEGSVIHAIRFDRSWYHNGMKSNGGWSLEMIDCLSACVGKENWKAAEGVAGGSPGRRNTVEGVYNNSQPLSLLNSYPIDSVSILLQFDQPPDSSTAASVDSYLFNQGMGNPAKATMEGPLYDKVQLTLAQPLAKKLVYRLDIKRMKSCTGNPFTDEYIEIGLPEKPGVTDLIINELLFNPRPGSSDYVEIYNNCKKVVDLKEVYLASRNNAARISAPLKLSTDPRLLLPGNYCLLTEDKFMLRQQYTVMDGRNLLEVPHLPSMPDDKGWVIIQHLDGTILDEVDYNEEWQFPLLNSKEGVALERISADASSGDSRNWHSAAAAAGYGTPGYRNSQAYTAAVPDGTFKIEPEMFSPDNDGVDDFTNVVYHFPAPGFVSTVTIYSAAGIPVKTLAKNELCGIKGSFRWDGLDEHRQRLPTGIYVLLIQSYTTSGKQLRFKKTITLGKNFYTP